MRGCHALRARFCLRPLALLLTALVLAACNSDDSAPAVVVAPGGGPTAADMLAADVRSLAAARSLSGDPSRGLLTRVSPADDPRTQLGMLLFFSRSLSADFDVACASCHHPDLGGGDGLSLPVGVAALAAEHLGPGRLVAYAQDADPRRDAGPNVPRNSQTIFNTALYDRALFHDGRAFVMDDAVQPGGSGQAIRTPDSGSLPDPSAGSNLLTAQARFPVTSPNEMRGYRHQELDRTDDYRAMLVDRLKGLRDSERISNADSARWLALFRAAYAAPSASADEIIDVAHLTDALATYERSQLFIDTAWRRWLDTPGSASLTADAQRGALLFFRTAAEGGLGCAQCHSGDHLTNEQFMNVGFPQIGRGKLGDGSDPGRWLVTQNENDRWAFRVPTLLNVELTAPYGHAGTFDMLEDVIRYHADPLAASAVFDFSLATLAQFSGLSVTYANAQTHTQAAIAHGNFRGDLLPQRALASQEVTQLAAFLRAQTDSCAASLLCRQQWVPDAAADPDGNLLVRNAQSADDAAAAGGGTGGVVDGGVSTYPAEIALVLPAGLTPLSAFADSAGCSSTPESRSNDGLFFVEKSAALGLVDTHGFTRSTWLPGNSVSEISDVLTAGGVTAGYLDNDCWPDLVYTGGDSSGTHIYRNRSGTDFVDLPVLPGLIGSKHTGSALIDLNGDFRRELVLGNLLAGNLQILTPDAGGNYVEIALLPMSRNTFGMSFGDSNGDGFPEAYFAHWDSGGLPGTAPAFWRNDGSTLRPGDGAAGTSAAAGITQNWQFAPVFADMNEDGLADLLVAADFGSTRVFRNTGTARFADDTDETVITDENGMGSALGDYDNDGDLDWFVTSVNDPEGAPLHGHWGASGNRLYRNDSLAGGNIRFTDMTTVAGVRDGQWGWAACFADFDNDGWLDIFHVNGWAWLPPDLITDSFTQLLADSLANIAQRFMTTAPRLFMNAGNGAFSEQATAWDIDLPMNGRGIACFDYDRDGDVDIAVLDHSSTPKFFENRSGNAAGHRFLSIRLVGRAPNTDALGARVYVAADLDGNGVVGPGETQMREAGTNSQFNSQGLPDLHVGLGRADTVQGIRIRWPDGSLETFAGPHAVNRFLVFHQP